MKTPTLRKCEICLFSIAEGFKTKLICKSSKSGNYNKPVIHSDVCDCFIHEL